MIRPFITPTFQPDNASNTTANRNAGFIPYIVVIGRMFSELEIAGISSRLNAFIHLYT